jgi:4-amino-4-deoxy-L-arabinose transferase-like glycosyltransferase
MTTSGGERPDTAATPAPWTAIAASVALVVAFRIPAFLEPHWYSDESTYAYVGRTIFGGGDLYKSAGAWDNKPPVQYWIYGILTHFLGYSEAAIHLVPFLSAVAAVIAVGWGVAKLTGSGRRAGIACVLAALIIGPPIFDSELFLPEGALIGPMAWAGMLMLVHIASPQWAARHRWAPYAAGFLASIALGMQQTVIADVVVIGVILLIASPSRWVDLLRFFGTGLVVTLLWLVPTIVASGIGPTWFATVAFYGIYAHNALPPTVLARVLHFAGIALGVIAIIGGAALVARRTRNTFWMLWMLAGIDLLVAGSAHFPYPHLLLPSIPWVCAALAATPWHRWRLLVSDRRRQTQWFGTAVLAAGVLLAAAQGSYAGSFWINGRSLSSYYASGYASLVSTSERTRWQDTFSGSIVYDQALTNWLVTHHYAHSFAVVWNVSDEWVYLTTPLTTVLPTVGLFNDDVLLGDRSKIGPYVARHRPLIIITDGPSVVLRPSVLTVIAQWYVAVYRVGPDTIYIERTHALRSASATSHQRNRAGRSAV